VQVAAEVQLRIVDGTTAVGHRRDLLGLWLTDASVQSVVDPEFGCYQHSRTPASLLEFKGGR
jgi:hypothetical protein